MKIDEYGRVSASFDEVFDLLYRGADLRDLFVDNGSDTDRFNALCAEHYKNEWVLKSPPELAHSPAEEHARRAACWFLPSELETLDVRAHVLSLCETPEQVERVNVEMDEFEARGMLPVLRAMIMLVAHFRKNNIVWGVGRGSSVASYVLFVLGVHKIDSLKYKLDLGEFFR